MPTKPDTVENPCPSQARHSPNQTGGLDRIDRQILAALQRDGRISNQELAEQVALSASPCLRRVRRLEQDGFIARYTAVLDPVKTGFGLLAYVNVKLEKGSKSGRGLSMAELFGREVLVWPEVVACYAMTGDLDYLLRVQVRDLDDFSRFTMDKLLKAPGVLDVRSSFALQTVKEGAALPVD